jgi:hypothetical protein
MATPAWGRRCRSWIEALLEAPWFHDDEPRAADRQSRRTRRLRCAGGSLRVGCRPSPSHPREGLVDVLLLIAVPTHSRPTDPLNTLTDSRSFLMWVP